MPESIHSYLACKFTNKRSFAIVNSFRDTNDHIWHFFKRRAHILYKPFCIKRHFRQIDQNRIISFKFSCQCACRCKPSRMTPHDLDDCHWFFIIIYRCVNCNLPHGWSHIFCRASKPRRMICIDKVVIDRFRYTQKANIASDHLRITRQFAHCIHRIISSDIKEITDVIFLKSFK